MGPPEPRSRARRHCNCAVPVKSQGFPVQSRSGPPTLLAPATVPPARTPQAGGSKGPTPGVMLGRHHLEGPQRSGSPRESQDGGGAPGAEREADAERMWEGDPRSVAERGRGASSPSNQPTATTATARELAAERRRRTCGAGRSLERGLRLRPHQQVEPGLRSKPGSLKCVAQHRPTAGSAARALASLVPAAHPSFEAGPDVNAHLGQQTHTVVVRVGHVGRFDHG